MSDKLKSDDRIKVVLACKTGMKMPLPLVGPRVPAGFPSPAQDYIEGSLDLNEHVIQHKASTFFVFVEGYSMVGAGIMPGDIIVVDRSLEAVNNKIIIAIYDGELVLKRLKIEDDAYWLCSENPDYKPIRVDQELDFFVWGVVTFVIHKV